MSTENTQETEASDISKEELKMLAEKLFDNELDRERINERKIRTQLTEQLLNTYKTVRDGLLDRAESILRSLGISSVIIRDVEVEKSYVSISFEDELTSVNDNIIITPGLFNGVDSVEEYMESNEFKKFTDEYKEKIDSFKKRVKEATDNQKAVDFQILKLEQQLFLLLQKKYTSANGIIDPTQMGDFLTDYGTMYKTN